MEAFEMNKNCFRMFGASGAVTHPQMNPLFEAAIENFLRFPQKGGCQSKDSHKRFPQKVPTKGSHKKEVDDQLEFATTGPQLQIDFGICPFQTQSLSSQN